MQNKKIDQLEVDRIKDVRKEDNKRLNQNYVLNIICKRLDEQGEQNIMLANPTEDIVDAWVEGISMLINPKPTTNMSCFVECLIDTQLLDLHSLNYEIPLEAPKMPQSLPADFNFNIVA